MSTNKKLQRILDSIHLLLKRECKLRVLLNLSTIDGAKLWQKADEELNISLNLQYISQMSIYHWLERQSVQKPIQI